MNGYTRTFRSASHVIWTAAMASILCLGTPAMAVEPIEIRVHAAEVDGARDIEAGNYTQGIERLLARLAKNPVSHTVRTPIIIDLCAAYTMAESYSAATTFCDQAVAGGWSTGLALNNRGALNVAKGDYESAIRDFEAAIAASGADRIARENLDRIETKVAALSQPSHQALARVAPIPK